MAARGQAIIREYPVIRLPVVIEPQPDSPLAIYGVLGGSAFDRRAVFQSAYEQNRLMAIDQHGGTRNLFQNPAQSSCSVLPGIFRSRP